MWLLPASSFLARLSANVFYRFSCSGPRPPVEGPVLIIANHPNSLVDAVLVSAVAGRGVRFLAKAPLFDLKRIGWLLRAVGAIPVYRRQDDATAVGQNVHTFAAVFDAFSRGAASSRRGSVTASRRWRDSRRGVRGWLWALPSVRARKCR